jgi:hypothetical protein
MRQPWMLEEAKNKFSLEPPEEVQPHLDFYPVKVI